MAGPSLYGSFRTGLSFGSGDASVSDISSRWGFKGSHEVAEGLTASYKYESKFNTTNAESSGGAGHTHGAAAASTDYDFDQVGDDSNTVPGPDNADGTPGDALDRPIAIYTSDVELDLDEDGNIKFDANGYATETTVVEDGDDTFRYFRVLDWHSSNAQSATDANGGPGGRLSYVALSGGFGTITLGQIWSASAIHYGFKVDPSYWNGVFGGANYRNGNSVSYSSNAGDVTFQIDKVTGDAEKLELGASADLGPVGIGIGNWSNANDEAGFTGIALSAGAAGVTLTVGLGSSKNATGVKSKMNVLNVGGSVGDTGLSYALQVANSDADGGAGDQNLIIVTNSLGSGASLIFEHVSHGDDTEASSLIALKVDF